MPRRIPIRPAPRRVALLALLCAASCAVHAAPETPVLPGDSFASVGALTDAATDVAKVGPAIAMSQALQTLEAAGNVADYALQLLGVGYRFGGSDPATGFDCSGFVQYVYRQAAGLTLPRSAKSMSRVGEKVSFADLMPGDIVFFNTRRFAFSHVGIYIGNNQFVHAPYRGRTVEVGTIDSRYWQQHFNGARRLVEDALNPGR